MRRSVAAGTTDAVLPGMILNLKKQAGCLWSAGQGVCQGVCNRAGLGPATGHGRDRLPGLARLVETVRLPPAEPSCCAALPFCLPQVSYHDAWLGAERSVAAGRLECTMQNLADCLVASAEAPLAREEAAAACGTFVVYNQRRKVRRHCVGARVWAWRCRRVGPGALRALGWAGWAGP